MWHKRVCIFIIHIIISCTGIAQQRLYDVPLTTNENFLIAAEDPFLINGQSPNQMSKRNRNRLFLLLDDTLALLSGVHRAVPGKPAFLKMHGNILYNFSYRSYIDTPFSQRDLAQHLVQTSVDFVFNEKYPVKMVVTNHSNNSPYFRDFTDVNFLFSKQQLLNNIKAGLLKNAEELMPDFDLNYLQGNLKRLNAQVLELQAWINSPARTQEMVEEKERILNAVAHTADTITKKNIADTADSIKASKDEEDITQEVKRPVVPGLKEITNTDSSFSSQLAFKDSLSAMKSKVSIAEAGKKVNDSSYAVRYKKRRSSLKS
ncbi:MAG: hypothetical protein QM791_22435 [Ferruginibacter sp.]